MWKPIKNYEALYEINESGEVRRLAGFWCRATRPLKPEVNKDTNAVRVKLAKDGKRPYKKFLLHRLVYETFVGPIPPRLTINHLDGNRLNNHVSNLEVATMREQMLHAYATGLQKVQRGAERGRAAKLTAADVRSIRRRYRPRVVTLDALAAEYGVSQGCIFYIVKRKRWTHI